MTEANEFRWWRIPVTGGGGPRRRCPPTRGCGRAGPRPRSARSLALARQHDRVVFGDLVEQRVDRGVPAGAPVGRVHVADVLVVGQLGEVAQVVGEVVVVAAVGQVVGADDGAGVEPVVAQHRHGTARLVHRRGGHADRHVGDDADQAGALGEVHRRGVVRSHGARGHVEGPAGGARLVAGPPDAGDDPGAVVVAVGVPGHGVEVGVDQPQPLGHEPVEDDGRRALGQPDAGLAGLLGDAFPFLQDRVGEAHDPLDAGTGRRGDLLRRLTAADPLLDDARGQFGPEVDVDLGEPPGVAAGRGTEPVVDRQLEPFAGLGVVALDGEHQARPVVGERHEAQCAHRRTSFGLARPVPGKRPGVRGYRRRAGPPGRRAARRAAGRGRMVPMRPANADDI